MKEINLLFQHERETKNTVVFSEVLNEEHAVAAIGTLYLQKPVHRELGAPKSLSIQLRSAAGRPEALV